MPYKKRAEQREYQKLWERKRRAKRQDYLHKLKLFIREQKAEPCADCKVSHPFYVMQFHHARGKKLFEINEVTRRNYKSRERILKEIKKCDLLCANCHATRHWMSMDVSLPVSSYNGSMEG